MFTNWVAVKTDKLTQELIKKLFENEIAAVRVPNFITPEVCKLAVQGIKEFGLEYYKNVSPPIGRIGITQNEHKGSIAQKLDYFSKAQAMHATREQVLKESGDLLIKVIEAVKDASGLNSYIAFEESIQKYYFAGLVRVIKQAMIHYDWAPLDAQGWTIENISSQLTWNIYLQMGGSGGGTGIYKRYWEKSDEAFRIPGSYGFQPIVTDGAPYVKVIPEEGELVLFNPRNYHEVEMTNGEGERITISSFMGLADNRKIIFWS